MDLYLNFEKPLQESELTEFRAKIKRRLSREPLQYVTGKCGFYGMDFKVDPSVLIPRPETETLIDVSLENIKAREIDNPKILEIGTGSGCISIAIAGKILCRIDSIDTSTDALKIAEENSGTNNTSSKINFQLKDIFRDVTDFSGYDIVISNPPYIAFNELETLEPEIRDFEPLAALTDNEDGLKFYRRIFELAAKTDGKTSVLLEIGDGKRANVENLVINMGITNYCFYKDLLNIDRVLYAEI
jgi:release factor glutamine methyltransferase